jgi:radical SAM protein with 4Fe4S-binding SPASM domain
MARIGFSIMITSSPTFCPAPWTSLNIDQTGRVSPCMHCFDSVGNIKESTIQQVLAGPIHKSIRETMARGQWHDACRLCKQSEEATGVSARTMRIATPETLAAIDNNIDWFEPHHIVVNWSNLCNLTCTYCNAETSTAWQSIKKIPINHVKNEHADLIELVKQHGHSVQGLTLGGGEPLLQKGLVDFLRCLLPQQVRVMVTTNLSVDLSANSVYQELRTWPSVDWQISFDNVTKEKFEYVRDRASWEQFTKNIDILKQDDQHVMAHPAYSIYCAFDIVEYYEFCEEKDLDIFWCELTHPWDLDVRRLAKPIRDIAVEEIDQVVARWGSKGCMATDTLQRYRANLIDPAYLTSFDTYHADPIKYSRSVEQELNKTVAFEQLWIDTKILLEKYHYANK